MKRESRYFLKTMHLITRRIIERVFFFVCAFLITYSMVSAGNNDQDSNAQPFLSEKASFAIMFKGITASYRILGVYVLPEELLTIEVVHGPDNASYEMLTTNGEATGREIQKWSWKAPGQTGLYRLKIVEHTSGDTISLHVFVMVPFGRIKDEYLNGYRIGSYPTMLLKSLSIYKPPAGFIEVTGENEDTRIAPHFTLKQFLCKQEGSYPKYVVLQEKLLIKLESILEKMNESGYRCNTLHIMSGYRTPYYNRAIGNVKYSRHIYGGAVDLFIDEDPPDGMMDDLNGDGTIDYRDAAIIYDSVDSLYGHSWYEFLVGGLARYKKTNVHGPFVHVDVRGFRARWGD
jgi:hypothetical protein